MNSTDKSRLLRECDTVTGMLAELANLDDFLRESVGYENSSVKQSDLIKAASSLHDIRERLLEDLNGDSEQ